MAERYYFDGGCRPNPGPIEIAVARGADVTIRTGLPDGDSSEAEWRALLLAVELAQGDGARDVTFVGDNAMVVAQAKGNAKCSARLQPFLATFQKETAGFDRVQVRYAPRSKNPAGAALDRRLR
jgi:ribonuclease HI